MIAQKTRYALRSLLFLAEEQGSAPVQLSRIAETQRVPPKYLELIMLDLKKAGLVKSARGPKGGYRLSRSPDQISFGEVVRTMEGPIALVSCASVNFYAPCGDCQDEATCAIRRGRLVGERAARRGPDRQASGGRTLGSSNPDPRRQFWRTCSSQEWPLINVPHCR